MRTGHSFRVLLENGAEATTFATSRFFDDSDKRLLRLNDGREFLVPRSALVPQSDGVYRLALPLSQLDRYAVAEPGGGPSDPPVEERMPRREVRRFTEGEKVVPVIEEQVDVERRRIPTGKVLIHKRVDADEVTVDEPVLHEWYDIERVSVNRLIDEPVEPYYEGDTFILPVLEEVVVVEKKLLLREEVHVRRKRKTERDPQKVSVRREHVDFERVPDA
jgi:uncharacterized protein (TIGR02271 family)